MVTVTGSTSCRGRRGGADGAPTSRRGGAGGGVGSCGRRGGADGGAALLVVLKHLNSRALDSTHHVLHDDVNFFFFGGDALQHLLGFPNRFRSCCFCCILHRARSKLQFLCRSARSAQLKA